MEILCKSLFWYALLCVLSSYAMMLTSMRELVIFCQILYLSVSKTGLPRSGKKFWKMKISRSGKSQGITFSVREILKNEKKSWKSQGISKFS